MSMLINDLLFDVLLRIYEVTSKLILACCHPHQQHILFVAWPGPEKAASCWVQVLAYLSAIHYI